jgi:predicted N-acetyltransferase YhbS
MTSFDTSVTHVPAAAFVPAPRLPAPAFVDSVGIDVERHGDAEARESLLDRAFGPARFRKTCERLRAGRLPARGLSLVARTDDRFGGGEDVGGERVGAELVGTVRLWHVEAGGVPALMLGPLAVDQRYRCHRLGGRLMDSAIARARALGHDAILLVGDAPYYQRFGFERRHTLALRMPGPVEDARFLGLELTEGALATAKGLVRATGAVDLAGRRAQHRPKLRRAA